MGRILLAFFGFALSIWPSAAQFHDLTATADGSVLYFASVQRQVGSDQPLHGKIFRVDQNGLSLFEARERVEPPPLPEFFKGITTNVFDMSRAEVSADGAVVGIVGLSDCLTSCDSARMPGSNVRARSGVDIEAEAFVRLSPNGRFAAFLPRLGIRPLLVLDLESGQRTEGPDESLPAVSTHGQVLSDTGALVYEAGFRPTEQMGVRLLESGADRLIIPTFNEDPEDAVIDAAGRQVVYASRWQLPTAPFRRIRVFDFSQQSARTVAEGAADFYAPSISLDGSLVLFLSTASGLPQAWLVNIDGSDRRALSNDPAGIDRAILAGHGEVAFAVTKAGRLIRIDIASGAVTELIGRTPDPKPPGFYRSAPPGSLLRLEGAGLVEQDVFAQSPFPTELAGLEYSVGGVRFPIIAASPGEALVQVPWELVPSSELQELVLRTDAMSAFEPPPVFISVGELAQAVWPAPESAGRPFSQPYPLPVAADVRFQRLITRAEPARPGETIHIYGTGFGRVQGDMITGLPASSDPLPRLLDPLLCSTPIDDDNWAPIKVLYAGLAPGLIGTYQVTIRIPNEPLKTPWSAAGGLFLVCSSQSQSFGALNTILPYDPSRGP